MINRPRARIARMPLGEPGVLSTTGDVHLWVLPTLFALGREQEQLYEPKSELAELGSGLW